MKKSVKALTFATAVMAAGMAATGCWNGFGGNVYGPPPSSNTRAATQDTKPEKPVPGKETDVVPPSEYDPTAEPEVDVYGPPPEDDPA